jgi:hypothetical protein
MGLSPFGHLSNNGPIRIHKSLWETSAYHLDLQGNVAGMLLSGHKVGTTTGVKVGGYLSRGVG